MPPLPVTTPTVVKFGGSLLDSADLDALLDVVERTGSVIVPGGGRFADAVRVSQSQSRFSDRAAHRMAIRAMEQTAEVLLDRAPTLAACDSRSAFAAAIEKGRGSIWLPAAMAMSADLPACWDVTSDSLALWLAIELKAPRLVLLKAAEVVSTEPKQWANLGIVDPYFQNLIGDFAGEILCVGPATPFALEAALGAPRRIAA